MILRPVVRRGVRIMTCSRPSPAQGPEYAASLSRSASLSSSTARTVPTSSTLQPLLKASSMWSVSKAISVPAAPASGERSPVVNMTSPFSTW